MRKKKKMAAPIVITVIIGLCYVGAALFCIFAPDIPLALRIVIAAAALALTCVLLYLLIERIKEIRSGEEDDLGKY